MTVPSEIVQQLRNRRHELGLTLEQVGRRIGVDRSQMGDWERGYHEPRLYRLMGWAKALGMKLELSLSEVGDGS